MKTQLTLKRNQLALIAKMNFKFSLLKTLDPMRFMQTKNICSVIE